MTGRAAAILSPELPMSTVKTEAIAVIERLPDDCTFEEIQYHLYVADLLRKRVAQADAGDFAPDEEVEKRLARWRRK
jgi:predicted transcriptional regulator